MEELPYMAISFPLWPTDSYCVTIEWYSDAEAVFTYPDNADVREDYRIKVCSKNLELAINGALKINRQRNLPEPTVIEYDMERLEVYERAVNDTEEVERVRAICTRLGLELKV